MPVLGFLPAPIRAPAKGWVPSWAPPYSPRPASAPPPPAWPPGGQPPPGWGGIPALIPPAAAAPLGIFAAAFLAGVLTNLAVRWLWRLWNSRIQAPGSWQPGEEYTWATAVNIILQYEKFKTTASSIRCSTGEVLSGPTTTFSTHTVNRSGCTGVRFPETFSYAYQRDCSSSGAPPTEYVFVQLKISAGWLAPTLIHQPWSGLGGNEGGNRVDGGVNGVRNFKILESGVENKKPNPTVDSLYIPPQLPGEEEIQRLLPFPLPLPGGAPALPEGTPEAVPDGLPLLDPPVPAPGVLPGAIPAGSVPRPGQLLPLRPPAARPIPPVTPSAPGIDTGTAVSPVVPAPVPVTPPGTEVIPGGVIGQPGTAPPATLEGIAAEVGKIEQKSRALLNRPTEGADLGALTDLLQLLLSLLQQVYGPGSYELAPVCEEKDPAVVAWGGGVGAFSQVNVKLDALAELLQAHKDFRQPVCATKASGQPVTVQFQEIG